MIASDVKNVGGSILKIAATLANGTYKSGEVLRYGIAQGGVDLDMTAASPVLPAATIAKIDALRERIIAGTLKVERYRLP